MIAVKDLVGMKEVDAIKTLGEHGVRIRVVHRDGENFIITSDFKTNRVNLSIEKGRVSKAEIG